jgi:hypothetical protein
VGRAARRDLVEPSRVVGLAGGDDVAGNLQQPLEELDRLLRAGQPVPAQIVEPGGERVVDRIVRSGQPTGKYRRGFRECACP